MYDNVCEVQELTSVGHNTRMGRLLRQYWIPALISEELQAGEPPLRLRLLGEDLVAFRGANGRVSVLDEHCPHRRASLFYGRLEEDGLRCIYHGLKFDGSGACVDAPVLPMGADIPSSLRAKSYPVREKGGLIWAYLGNQPDHLPELPAFPVLDLPADELRATCMQRECNFLQTIEGEMDGSHVTILHAGHTLRADSSNLGSHYALQENPVGVTAALGIAAGDTEMLWRFSHFLLPFYTQPSAAPLGADTYFRAWVPMDDTHTMVFQVSNPSFCLSPDEKRRPLLFEAPGMSLDYDYLPNTTHAHGRWRVAANRQNDHNVTRSAEGRSSFSGIEGLEIQDLAIQESMGPIVDRRSEHLLPSDAIVVKLRQMLVRTVREYEAGHGMPPGVDDAMAYRKWAGFVTAPATTIWQTAYESVVNKL